ncbi:hypothetical protein CDL12_20354 [Handroanthus impetiginosus]|uniref:Type 2 DNA topoisomerase 6 subunit B-like n=1 Tax=Handroanthus impetiginosus TaxID=429701 RepID=A0A2G9GPF3_9LAMI|nr:hypothetical protein CDL12_20354 [Handroanthus impetiginosus]
MEGNSVEKLCKFLISCAFRRCRMLDDLCRVSVSLKPASPLIRISVSDTGTGSTLEELQELKYENDPLLAGKWDGVLCIATTSISDKEIHHIKFDLKEVVSSRRLVRLPSATKNGAIFSGTEVSLSVFEEIDGLATKISVFIQKKIAVELSVESGGREESQNRSIILQNACSILPLHSANIGYLKWGLEDYVSKHGNRLAEACDSCFPNGKNLRIGTGIACSKRNQQSGGEVMEVVIIFSEKSVLDGSSCARLYGRRTEVLYFRDFLPCSISQSSLDALTSIEWKNYGLLLKSVGDQDGVTLLEWENLPPEANIDIAFHRYHEHTRATLLPCTQSHKNDRFLTRKAVKLALNDLKERNAGLLLSERANKICRYAPDLAKTISGLILSSHDVNFQGECLSLLGLQSQEKDVLENRIKDQIISAVARDDRNPGTSREASYLFVDGDVHQTHYGPDEEHHEGEEAFDYCDL